MFNIHFFFRPKLSLPKPVPAAIGNQMIDRHTDIQTNIKTDRYKVTDIYRDRQIYRQKDI